MSLKKLLKIYFQLSTSAAKMLVNRRVVSTLEKGKGLGSGSAGTFFIHLHPQDV